MELQTLLDSAVVLFLFAARIGAPLVLVVTVGYWFERQFKPLAETEPRRHVLPARAMALE